MTDREILDKYINLDNSYLTKAEKKEVRELVYKYKDAFSLRMKWNLPQHQSRNIGHRQDPILHKTFPQERGR